MTECCFSTLLLYLAFSVVSCSKNYGAFIKSDKVYWGAGGGPTMSNAKIVKDGDAFRLFQQVDIAAYEAAKKKAEAEAEAEAESESESYSDQSVDLDEYASTHCLDCRIDLRKYECVHYDRINDMYDY